MIIHYCEQLGAEWWELRAGVPTASEFKRIIMPSTGLPSKGQAGYAADLFKESVSPTADYFTNLGKPVNVHVQRGRNLEEEAVAWYAMVNKVTTRKVGFVTTDDKRFGCSPDALIEDQGRPIGGIEIKCPAKDKHEANVAKGVLPLEYKCQVHGCLAVTGLPYWIFLEYCPDSVTPTLCIKVEPDEFTQALNVQLEAFDGVYKAVKAKLGIGPKESAVTEPEKVEAWKIQLDQRPTMETLNSWLPELAEIQDKATKVACWRMIEAYAKERYWLFNRESKQFYPELAQL